MRWPPALPESVSGIGTSKPNDQLKLEIVERKRTEKALRDNEERYRALSDASFEAIFISEKGICIDTNQTATDMFGYLTSPRASKPSERCKREKLN